MNAIEINHSTISFPAGGLQNHLDAIVAHLDARGVAVSDLEAQIDGSIAGSFTHPIDVDPAEEIDAVLLELGEVEL